MIASVAREDLAVATGSTSLKRLVRAAQLTNYTPSVTYLFRTTGQVIGVSLSGALLQTVLTSKLRERIHGPDAISVRHISTRIARSAGLCLRPLPPHASTR